MAASVRSFGQTSTWLTTTTPKTVATSWEQGDVVVVFGVTSSGSTNLATPTVSGLTFSLVVSAVDGDANEVNQYMWSAKAASSGSGSVSMAATGGAAFGFCVWVDMGVADISAQEFINRTEATTNLTVSAGSIVHYGCGDWNASATGKSPATGSGTATERADGNDGGVTYGWGAIDWVGTSAATTAFGLSSYTSYKIGQAAVEVLVDPSETEQEGFRWRNDDGSETTATWRQTQDVDDTAALDEQVRLRVLLDSTGDPGSTQYRLEYKEDSEAAGLWRAVGVGLAAVTPTIVGAGSGALTASASPTVTIGSWTPAAGDIVMMLVTSGVPLAAATSDPTGWVNVLGVAGEINSDSHGMVGFYHIVTGAEETAGTTTYTITNALTTTHTGEVIGYAIRGVDQTTPVNTGLGATAFSNTNLATPHVLAALTGARQPTVTNGLVLRAVAADGIRSWTTPAGHSLVGDVAALNVYTRDAATTAGVDVAATNITPSSGDEYVSITVAFGPAATVAAVTHGLSSQFADGAATTVQLTAPAAKSTSDFDAGVMVEGQALADAVDITADDYTEVEWVLKAQTPAVDTDVYQFRVTANGSPLTTYTVTPELTVGADSSVTLIVQDATHAHTAANVALTQHQVLTVANATHAHTAANVALTQHQVLVVAGATHGHTAAAVALTQHQVLTVASSVHAHSAENVALTQHQVLAVSAATHAHSVEPVALTQHHTLTVASATHAHSAANVTLGIGGVTLVVADTVHGHTAAAVVLIQHHVLVVASSTHAHTAAAVTLTQHQVLAVADAIHGHSAENVTLAIAGVLDVHDATHGHTAASVGLVQHHTLTVASATHGHTAANVTLTIGVVTLVVDGTVHGHSVAAVVLTQHHALTVGSATHGHTAETLALIQLFVLMVDNAGHAHHVDNIAFTPPIIGGHGTGSVYWRDGATTTISSSNGGGGVVWRDDAAVLVGAGSGAGSSSQQGTGTGEVRPP